MIMFEVVEKFVSINGEAACAGELAVFVRFKGCNLNCTYCDTKWANFSDTKAELMSAGEIVKYISDCGIHNVTLTGGEPLLQRDMKQLVRLLIDQCGCRVEIETNGSANLTPLTKDPQHRPVFTMDYKLPSSGCESAMRMENFELLDREDTVKFVSGSREDLERAYEIMQEYSLTDRCHVYFSPVFGSIEPASIVDFMQQRRLNKVRLQIQMHKVIWDPNQRGV
jgi:7-carboxy-7-deazaguanine synthase